MKVQALVCPRCSAPLDVDTKQGLVHCKYCGSTLYIDAENSVKLNASKISDSIEDILSKMKQDQIKNHTALAHGHVDSRHTGTHFQAAPNQKKTDIPCAARAIILIPILPLFFYLLWTALNSMSILPACFVSLLYSVIPGGLVGLLFYGIYIVYYKHQLKQSGRRWESDRAAYIKKIQGQMERSKLIELLTKEIEMFYKSLIEEATKYNVKAVRLHVNLFSKGCVYFGTVNCPYRTRLNNEMIDEWKELHRQGIPFHQNDFIELNIEQQEICFRILSDRLRESTKGIRSTVSVNQETFSLEFQYDNPKYKDPAIHEIW